MYVASTKCTACNAPAPPPPSLSKKDKTDTLAATKSHRGSRAEALVQHVAQQPSFLAWAATSTSVTPTTVTSPQTIAQYLEARVAEVAGQLSSLRHAGDFKRLVLLAELLHGDMASGVTPRMIEGGLLDLLRAISTAVAQGEVGRRSDVVAAAPLTNPLHGTASSLATHRAADMPNVSNIFHATAATQHSTNGVGGLAAAAAAFAAPIESLLPPLIDQTMCKPKSTPPSVAGTLNNDVTYRDLNAEEDAEMEAWENYMATVRVATTADAVNAHDPASAQPLPFLSTSRVERDATTVTVAAGVAPEPSHTIDCLPAALCALIACCTTSPFVCLSLSDQQCEKAAVVDVARVLLDTTKAMGSASKEMLEVRLAAIKGLFQLLSTYVAGGNGGAVENKSTKSRAWRSTKAARASQEGATAATAGPPAMAMLDSTHISAMLDDIVQEWARILVSLKKTAPSNGAHNGQAAEDLSGDDADGIGSDDELTSRGASALMAAAHSGGPAGELYWVLEIVYQLLQALQCKSNGSSCNDSRLPSHRLLPQAFVPVALHTLSMLPTTPSLSRHAAMYVRLCVDVLWTASLLAPVTAARQLLYGSLPEGLADHNVEPHASLTSAHKETNAPAVDFFLALLHQCNQTHSLAHREMRDDLVTLLALLLRCDAQFAEDELVARRAAARAYAKFPDPFGEEQEDGNRDAVEPDSCTPLSLTVPTVEAINAVVALMFEATCGAELSVSNGTTASKSNGRTAADNDDLRPSALLSEDAVRAYALRFQSVSISAARRREVVEFKLYGWQLLAVHVGWQLAHLTLREYVAFHDTDAPSSLPPSVVAGGSAEHQQEQQRHHQHSAPLRQATGESAGDEAVTAALWGMQLCRLGYFDVLLLYVDMDSTVPAVVTWTREELMILEVEAWQLFTSMILFTQHLDAVSGGVSVRRHRCFSPVGLSQRVQEERHDSGPYTISSHEVSGASIGAASDGFDDDDEAGGVLYGADMNFIEAGGVDVALRFLSAAPPEMEAVKRSALITLAAIARTSSSGEVHLHSGTYTGKEVAFVHRALTKHAPTLVPFLVKIIREVDMFVDVTGTPAVGPTLISSVAAVTVEEETNGRHALWSVKDPAASFVHSAARWGWLPQSMFLTVVLSWCLLRCIGDVVLSQVGMMRELPDTTVRDSEGDEEEVEEDDNSPHSDVDDDDAYETTFVDHCELTVKNAMIDAPHGDNSDDEAVAGRPCARAIEIKMTDDNVSSSSGSSMGPPPGDKEEQANESAKVKVGRGTGGAFVKLTLEKTANGTLTSDNAGTNGNQQSDNDLESTAARRYALLRSMHEEVLLIPDLFANEGGIDLLTMWMRHTLALCFSVRTEHSPLMPHTAPRRRTPPMRLAAEEVAELDRTSDLFLLLLDVFRAIVLGSEGNEEQFVCSGGVHEMLDLIEAYALAHGLMERAAYHARVLAADNTTAAAYTDFAMTQTAKMTLEKKEKRGVLPYAITLLSDLLDRCPCALNEFSTWHSRYIFTSPLTPDVQECWTSSKGIEAVQLMLCLWAADLPARNDWSSTTMALTSSGLEVLRLRLRHALRKALKEEYVSRLLCQRAKLGALDADAIRCYYHYIHAEDEVENGLTSEKGKDEVMDTVVLAYMERLMSHHHKCDAVPSDQRIALLVNDTLGLCLKVYGCLAAVRFDSLQAADAETVTSPSLPVHLSPLERSFLVQIAALPALCVDEISTAMSEVALESDAGPDVDVNAWRPTTPDRRTLSTAAAEAAVRANELNQIIEMGAQVQEARGAQLYHRFLVTQLRQPVAPPADGQPGAVKGAWKTQRRLSTTIGGRPVSSAAMTVGSGNERPGTHAAKLAAHLSLRLAAEEQEHQQRLASVVLQKSGMAESKEAAEEQAREGTRMPNTAPPVLGSNRTPYTSLMNSVHAAAAERQPASPFSITSPPRRPVPPLAERVLKRQTMIARSVRKVPLHTASEKNGRKL